MVLQNKGLIYEVAKNDWWNFFGKSLRCLRTSACTLSALQAFDYLTVSMAMLAPAARAIILKTSTYFSLSSEWSSCSIRFRYVKKRSADAPDSFMYPLAVTEVVNYHLMPPIASYCLLQSKNKIGVMTIITQYRIKIFYNTDGPVTLFSGIIAIRGWRFCPHCPDRRGTCLHTNVCHAGQTVLLFGRRLLAVATVLIRSALSDFNSNLANDLDLLKCVNFSLVIVTASAVRRSANHFWCPSRIPIYGIRFHNSIVNDRSSICKPYRKTFRQGYPKRLKDKRPDKYDHKNGENGICCRHPAPRIYSDYGHAARLRAWRPISSPNGPSCNLQLLNPCYPTVFLKIDSRHLCHKKAIALVREKGMLSLPWGGLFMMFHIKTRCCRQSPSSFLRGCWGK